MNNANNGNNVNNNQLNNNQLNNQTSNQQMMNQQFGGPTPNNNQFNQNNNSQQIFQNQNLGQVNNQQMMNQQFQQPNNQFNQQQVPQQSNLVNNMQSQMINNQVPNYQANNPQPQMINNQVPNYQVNNPQPNYMNNQIPNNSKNNKKLFIIIGSIIFGIIILGVILLITLGNNDDKENNNVNDYEDETIGGSNYDDEDNKDTISFKGFEFKKQDGYKYEIDSNGLIIGNNTFATLIEVSAGSYEQVESQSQLLMQQYIDMGIEVNNYKVEKYGSKEVMTFELTKDNQSFIMYITEANNSTVFVGMTMNPSYTIDYSNVKTAINLIKDSKFTGNYKVPNEEIKSLEIIDLFK